MSQSAAKTSSPAVRRAPRISADYESARSTADNLNLWANADALSADAAISVGVRRRSATARRHEVANNSYLKGAQLTIANDTIGVGPTLQMNVKAGDGVTEAEAQEINSFIEDEYDARAREIRQAEKLRTCRASRFETGESFLMFVYNPRLRPPGQARHRRHRGGPVRRPRLRRQRLRGRPAVERRHPA
jgi:hypothetical protein